MKKSNILMVTLIICMSIDYIAIAAFDVKYSIELLRNRKKRQSNKRFITKSSERFLYILIILLVAFVLLLFAFGVTQSEKMVALNVKTITSYGLIALISPSNIVVWLAFFLVWVNKKHINCEEKSE